MSAPWVVAIALGLAACGDADSDPTTTPTAAPAVNPTSDAAGSLEPKRVEVPTPNRPLRGAIDIEALSETVDGWLGSLGNKLRIRDFDGIAQAFAEDFVGEPLFPDPTVGEPELLPLGVERRMPAAPATVLARAPFLASIEEAVGPWTRVSQSSIRLVSATFERAGEGGVDALVDWARADVRIHVVGHTDDGGTLVLDARATAKLTNNGGDWRMDRFRVDSQSLLRHAQPMYSEVSRAVGVAHDGLRYGEPGNDGDGWNGAAAADVNGDGRVDLYVPGSQRGFLYRATADGRYEEEGLPRGLAQTGGGTGAVFFDYDRDGDQDLAIAFIGWIDLDESSAGRNVSLFENDGSGRFRDVSKELGLRKARVPAYSLTAFDADGDGWTDLFVCGYGRMDHRINDSWIEATNGSPDLLLRNKGGEAFEDVTLLAGMDDRRWSYCSAAADFDEDGDLDLFVGNNFGTSRLWRNRGDGTFEDVAEELGVNVCGNVMGALWTDLDSDGRLDLYLASPTSTSGNRILSGVAADGSEISSAAAGMMQMANGNKTFLGRDVAGEDGVPRATFEQVDRGANRSGWAWSVASPDVDLDGRRDIVCVNGFVTGELSGDT